MLGPVFERLAFPRNLPFSVKLRVFLENETSVQTTKRKRMGLYCSQLRDAAFSNPRRRPAGAAPAPQAPTLDPCTSQSRESRIKVLRALSFEEGFALGIRTQKLETLLLKLDAGKVDPTPASPESLDDLLKEKWCRISKG